MPDRFGFDHLGTERRCIECGAGGPAWLWREGHRATHAAAHERARAGARDRARKAQLRQARRLKALAARENGHAK